jgi:septum formation topological specificity factor MinE
VVLAASTLAYAYASHRTSRARPKYTSTMKQRLTYVVKKPESFTPDLVEVKNDGSKDIFALKGVEAAKEHRITLGLDELPSEVGTYLHIKTVVLIKIAQCRTSRMA